MIRAVYFIDFRSGIPLFAKTYSDIGIDSVLLGSFFKALSDFAVELVKDGLEKEKARKGTKISGSMETYLEQVSIKGFDLIYEIKNPVVVVAIIDKRDDEDAVRDGLKKLLELFALEFKDLIGKQSPNVSQFKIFEGTVNDILKHGKLGIICPVLKGALPKFALSMGLIDREEYEVAQLCNGNLTVDEIAEKLNKRKIDTWSTIEELKKKGLIELKTVE